MSALSLGGGDTTWITLGCVTTVGFMEHIDHPDVMTSASGRQPRSAATPVVGHRIRLDRAFVRDPHSLYRRLRVDAPAHRVEIWGGTVVWLVTRYAEARELLSDPRLVKDQRRVTSLFPPGGAGPMQLAVGANMLFSDPPTHTRLRRLVAKAFTVHSVAHMAESITAIADELLDDIAPASHRGEVDLIARYAAPLPVRVIGQLLGVPEDVAEQFRALVAPVVTEAKSAVLHDVQRELEALLSRLAEEKRRTPSNDLLTVLVDAADDGDRLSEAELTATVFLLIFAGYETTVNLIGNGIEALARHPDQFRRLRENPELLGTAVEEFLRYESPLNTATLRVSSVDVQLGETTIPANELVMISLLSAGRDERQYPAPDTLDVGRHPNPHLAFGHGIHHCVGAPLARLEARIAFGRLLERFDRLELAKEHLGPHRNSLLMRGRESLPVVLREVRRPIESQEAGGGIDVERT